MRGLILGLFVASLSSATAADSAAPFWTAICRGDKDANYTQTVGADGVFNQGQGDGTYQTLPVRQSFYTGKIVCGAAQGAAQFAQVCADNERQIIYFRLRDSKKPKAPLRDVFYCKALVKVH